MSSNTYDLYISIDSYDIFDRRIDAHILLNLLAEIDSYYYEIGLSLRLSLNFLRSLRLRNEGCAIKLNEVIYTWIHTQSSPVTWNTVISAIEGPIVRNLMKANEIREYLRNN